MATEYVVLIVLAALAAILIVARFGGGVGRKADEAGQTVAQLKVEGPGGAPASGTGGAGTGGGGEVGGEAGDEGPAPLPEEIDTHAPGGGAGPDTRTLVLLGIIVVTIGMLMVVVMAQRIRKDSKKKRRV